MNGKFMCKGFVLSLVMAFVLTSGIFGQSNTGIRQLGELLEKKEVTLKANGNGSSSGTAVYGVITNTTSAEIRVNVIINNGIYLANSGAGQNMVATQVLLSGLSYYHDKNNYYIILKSNSATSVVFIAYCADFDRSNPAAAESFAMAATPQDIMEISARISRYMADNFGDDETVAVQLALWRSRGKNRSEIAKVFSFDDDDWNLSSKIMNY